MRTELVIRFDYGKTVPWVRRGDDGLTAIAGPDALRLHTPVDLEGKDFRTVGRFEVRAGETVPFRLSCFESYDPEPPARDPQRPPGGHRRLLAGLDRPVPGRRAVARRGGALADHAQGADLRARRRHRRRRHHLAAGADRRRSQLGLPLLLDPRCDLHPLRLPPLRSARGGAVVAGMAAARDRRQAVAAADPLWRRRRAADPRAGAAVARRLRGQPPGADRQCGA